MATVHDFPGGESRSGTQELPSLDHPLRGCERLASVALLGESAILEAATRPVSWAWDGISEVGSVTMLAGTPGGGKTTLLFLLLVARLAGGLDLLGHRVTRSNGYCVLIEGEHGEGSAARKLVNSCAMLGVRTAVLDRMVLVARAGVLIGDERWADAVRMIRAGVVSDLAVDTLARCSSADGSSEQEQTRIMQHVGAAIEAGPEGSKPAVWVNAHTRKGTGTGTVEDVSGSAARTAQCDTVMLVEGNRDDAGKIESSTVRWPKVREAEQPDAVAYSTRFGRLQYVETPGKSKGGRPPTLTQERVLAALRELAPVHFRELRETLECGQNGLQAWLSTLEAAGTVRKTPAGYELTDANE